jgi:type II secretory pathway component PulK
MNLHPANPASQRAPLWSAAACRRFHQPGRVPSKSGSKLPHSRFVPRLSGSVLIIVMWIAFGVVALALYFAHSMEMNMRAAENQMASQQADQAIESAAIYYSNVLVNLRQPNMLPQTNNYKVAAVHVGDAMFWCIGRDTNDMDFSHRSPDPLFCLVDEASKANLNNTNIYGSPDTSTNLLQNLPQMTIQIVSCMYDWNTSNANPTQNGAKSSVYQGLNPPYYCKQTNYETIDELRMVYNMNLDLLYGEDANLNGALDPNENDGMLLPPNDNNDGMLDSGILEYVTVYTHEPTNFGIPSATLANMYVTTNRESIADTGLSSYIQTNFPTVYSTIQQKLTTMSAGGTAPTNLMDFILKTGIAEADFITIEPYLYGTNLVGLINVNTATATSLACIPGIGYNNAQTILNFRQGVSSRLNSIYWLKDAMAGLGTNAMLQAGSWVTSHSFQFSADIAAVGRYGRGYRRVKFVYDCSSGIPQIIYRQDLTYLGWGLGKSIHDQLLAGTLR